MAYETASHQRLIYTHTHTHIYIYDIVTQDLIMLMLICLTQVHGKETKTS